MDTLRPMRTILWLFLLTPTLLYAQVATLAGKWRGEAGPPDNHAVFGLEISAAANGRWVADFYQDNLGYYALPLGEIKEEGKGQFAIPGAGLELWREGPALRVTGLLENPQQAVAFASTPVLPKEPPLPDWPSGPGPLWQRSLGGPIYATAAVSDGYAYVGNTDGVFYAIAVSDGSLAWTFTAGRPIYGEARVTADAVYFACDNGFLYRLDRATGKERWRYDLGDSRSARIPPSVSVHDYDRQSPQPLLVDGVLYVGAGDGSFHAVRAETGTRAWRTQWPGKIRTTAATHADAVIFSTIDGADRGRVIALKRSSGELLWQFDAGAPVATTPVVRGNVVVTGTRGERTRLLGLDATSGALLWSQYYWGSWVESEAAPEGGNAYIGSGDLFAVSDFDPATGRNHWRSPVYGWVLARPAVTPNAVFAGVSSAHRNLPVKVRQLASLTRLDRKTGQIVWRWPMPDWPGAFLDGFIAAPAVSADRLLIGGLNGSLYAFPAD